MAPKLVVAATGQGCPEGSDPDGRVWSQRRGSVKMELPHHISETRARRADRKSAKKQR